MDRCCSCGARLFRASSFRRLASPVFRMFMSIRVLKTLPSHTKVCNKCRQSYAYWKRCNPEFTNILDRIEEEFVENDESEDDQVEDMDTNVCSAWSYYYMNAVRRETRSDTIIKESAQELAKKLPLERQSKPKFDEKLTTMSNTHQNNILDASSLATIDDTSTTQNSLSQVFTSNGVTLKNNTSATNRIRAMATEDNIPSVNDTLTIENTLSNQDLLYTLRTTSTVITTNYYQKLLPTTTQRHIQFTTPLVQQYSQPFIHHETIGTTQQENLPTNKTNTNNYTYISPITMTNAIYPKFGGFPGEDASEWLYEIDRLLESLNPAEKRQKVDQILTGKAMIWYIHNRHEIKDWSTFIELFVEKHSPAEVQDLPIPINAHHHLRQNQHKPVPNIVEATPPTLTQQLTQSTTPIQHLII
ncbi:unnamed protein product [Didymodactylos carnosus]|uniref:Uncharacterized protein n=1 Tax=Didymodactylos carnosus TaxID=1234261 RepID=A0A8S2D6D8_9BILA|nr:unnamed protein product [Didymodactylos carnosus]CAF3608668.1 unnamed protein product [Didymodactylos carnosus]